MILSIESSCDDSSIAITEIGTKKIIYHKKISQEAEHSCYGGVVPELASRLHAVALPEILKETKELIYTVKNIPAFESEPYSLPENVLLGQLHYYYTEVGTANSYWGDYSSLFPKWMDGFIQEI